jgi:hypothetical protein
MFNNLQLSSRLLTLGTVTEFCFPSARPMWTLQFISSPQLFSLREETRVAAWHERSSNVSIECHTRRLGGRRGV